jgi:hypothetical protein
MIHRVILLLGTAMLALAGGLYFVEDEGVVSTDEPEQEVVSIDEPERELLLPAGTATRLTFRINNPTRRAVRVLRLSGC